MDFGNSKIKLINWETSDNFKLIRISKNRKKNSSGGFRIGELYQSHRNDPKYRRSVCEDAVEIDNE